MKVEVDVLGSPSLIVRAVSVDVKQHLKKKIPTMNCKIKDCLAPSKSYFSKEL